MGAFEHDSSIEGDVYVQRLATYIRRNEEALANGLLCFSKVRSASNIKPLRQSFTTHHLYYITERIANSTLDVDVGPLNVKLDSPFHEPTFILFMANHALSQRNFESDARSITSMNSIKLIVSSALVYWMSFSFSKDPKVIQKDIKYLYSLFTKLPCLILSPRTKINSVTGYEEYPCDTSVPLKMFKNLQVLELVEYEPNEVYGWHTLSEQLRILIVRNTKLTNIADALYSLVLDDESGRSSFNIRGKKTSESLTAANAFFLSNTRRRAMTLTDGVASHKLNDVAQMHPFSHHGTSADHPPLPPSKWYYLKQLTVTGSSIAQVPSFVFQPFVNLVKLNLSNNLLDDLPEGLEHLQCLKYLNLADNYISNLEKFPRNLRCLLTLNFNNNKLTNIEGLEYATALQKIDLRCNKLDSLALLYPLVKHVSSPTSQLDNVFVTSNKLHKTYRADLFNLFNGAKPRNTIKIDDSRPGYFESAMLLDPASALKNYEKFMAAHVDGSPADSSQPEEADSSRHRHNSSATDALNSLALLNIDDLEQSITSRKHSSVMTTASSTTIAPSITTINHTDSGPPSPSVRSISKSIKPLLTNQNLCNQAQFTPTKMPQMVRNILSPMINVNNNGSNSTLKSTSTMTRFDLEPPLVNLAPNVITPVQVQVEGFQ